MLDLEQLKNLSDEQRQRYMRAEQVFETDGWKDIEDWAERQAEAQGLRQLNAAKWEDALVSRGARAAFMLVAQLKKTTEAEYAVFAEQNAEQATVADEAEHE